MPSSSPSSRAPSAASPLALPPRAGLALWDLDGTLCESGPVIVASMRDVLAQLGHSDAALDPRDVVGPPMRHNLASAGVPAALMDRAVGLYRAAYLGRAHEAPVYPGVVGALERVREAGVVQVVATSKATDIARTQLAGCGLAGFFEVISGSLEEDGWSTPKVRVVAHALAGLRERGLPGSDPVMIGDRRHDVEGAAQHGIPTLAARWGYGTAAEWDLAAGAVDAPAQVPGALGV